MRTISCLPDDCQLSRQEDEYSTHCLIQCILIVFIESNKIHTTYFKYIRTFILNNKAPEISSFLDLSDVFLLSETYHC